MAWWKKLASATGTGLTAFSQGYAQGQQLGVQQEANLRAREASDRDKAESVVGELRRAVEVAGYSPEAIQQVEDSMALTLQNVPKSQQDYVRQQVASMRTGVTSRVSGQITGAAAAVGAIKPGDMSPEGLQQFTASKRQALETGRGVSGLYGQGAPGAQSLQTALAAGEQELTAAQEALQLLALDPLTATLEQRTAGENRLRELGTQWGMNPALLEASLRRVRDQERRKAVELFTNVIAPMAQDSTFLYDTAAKLGVLQDTFAFRVADARARELSYREDTTLNDVEREVRANSRMLLEQAMSAARMGDMEGAKDFGAKAVETAMGPNGDPSLAVQYQAILPKLLSLSFGTNRREWEEHLNSVQVGRDELLSIASSWGMDVSSYNNDPDLRIPQELRSDILKARFGSEGEEKQTDADVLAEWTKRILGAAKQGRAFLKTEIKALADLPFESRELVFQSLRELGWELDVDNGILQPLSGPGPQPSRTGVDMSTLLGAPQTSLMGAAPAR